MHRVMVRNPESGNGTDADVAAVAARRRDVDVRDSSRPGEAVTIARDAVGEADQILACGGDGTVNEVVEGVDDADALGEVELAVVPTGTGNDFAGHVGVESVEHAFDVADRGDCRRLDLGLVDGDVFVNSCMGGLIAEASDHTSDELKARIGSLAYALQTLAEARNYDGPTLSVEVGESHDPLWSGEAVVVLVGNGRRFFGTGRGQADLEDGKLEVVIAERAPAIDYLADDAIRRLVNETPSHLTQLVTEELAVTAVDQPMEFSLDGETLECTELDARARPAAMRFRVGDAYEPTPPAWPPQ